MLLDPLDCSLATLESSHLTMGKRIQLDVLVKLFSLSRPGKQYSKQYTTCPFFLLPARKPQFLPSVIAAGHHQLHLYSQFFLREHRAVGFQEENLHTRLRPLKIPEGPFFRHNISL